MLPADRAGLGPPWLPLDFRTMAAPAHVQIQNQEIICDQTIHHQTGRVGPWVGGRKGRLEQPRMEER